MRNFKTMITAIISCAVLAASCGSAPTPAAEEPGPVSQEPEGTDPAPPVDSSEAFESEADIESEADVEVAETDAEAVEPPPAVKDDFVLEGSIVKKKGPVFHADLGAEGNAVRMLEHCTGKLFVWVEPEEGDGEWVEAAMVEIVDQSGATSTLKKKDLVTGKPTYYTTQHVSFKIESKADPATGTVKIKKGARVKFEKKICGLPL